MAVNVIVVAVTFMMGGFVAVWLDLSAMPAVV